MSPPLAISKKDYEAFDNCLQAETELLEQWFIEQVFTERELEAGSEIEFSLLDNGYDPIPHNLDFIEKFNEPFLIPEVGAAHLEINSCHVSLSSNFLSVLHQDILNCWQRCCDFARKNHYHLALIGSLPTGTEEHHQASWLTNKPRYHMLNTTIKEQCNGRPFNLNLKGYETLSIQPQSLAIDGLISAFQLHIQIGLSQSVRYYNVAQAIAGPMLTLACNSPFIFNQHVWNDSRIFIFDQVMTFPRFDRARGFKCCIFGNSYLKDSFFELFDQNYQFYPRLLPEVSLDSPPENMLHVKRQNSIIYRWNRPVIDFNHAHKPHLRIEHRGPSVGPTIVDMVANAAFFYGLINYFAIQPTPIEYYLPFHLARKNFFNAARLGFDAEFNWFLGKKVSACNLLKSLLPKAWKGLQSLGVTPTDITYYLGIIEQRINKKLNGSEWQSRFVKKYGKDFHALMEQYLQNQYQEIPVSEWKI